MPQRQRHFWIDDVTMNIRAVFNGQSDGRAQPILFTGTSEFWTIPLDNRKHIATMFVPPQILDRYLRPMAVNRTSFSLVIDGAFFPRGSGAEARNKQNTILFKDRAGTVIGTGYYGQRGMSDKDYAEYFSKLNAGAALTIPGAILPRNLTPWAYLDIDDFDFLKPAGGRAAEK